MKKIFKLLYTLTIGVLLFLAFGYTAKTDAADSDYYSDITETATGDTLLQELFTLIDDSSVVDKGYDYLWTAYTSTDTKLGTDLIWDMYSNTNYISEDPDYKGSNISGEGTSYNREHAICQSFFASASPMVSDIHFIYPVDGYTNTQRNDNVYGEVDTTKTISYTSSNGSMVGKSKTSITATVDGTEYIYTTDVFEINDQYKGDIARAYFYFATRYSDELATYITNTSNAKYIFTGSYPYLTSYAYNLFMKWNYEDPVSEKETARNEAVYKIQKNRNPYIDHPEYVASIWESAKDTYDYTGDFTYATLTVDTDKVASVEALIDKIPSELDYSARATVLKATDAYLLLNDSEKAAVNTAKYNTMLEALETVADLKEPDPGNVTYVISSKESVTTEGTAPDGSSATFINTTKSSDKWQITTGYTMTLTLSGYGKKILSGIGLYTKSNKDKGACYLLIQVGDTTVYSFGSADAGVSYSDASFRGSYSGIYAYVTKTFDNFTVPDNKDITITIGGTENSVYCQRISIIYSTGITDQFEKLSTKTSMRFHYSSYNSLDASDAYYELCKDASEIKAGTQFVIGTLDGNYGMARISSSTDTKFPSAAITVSNERISDTSGLALITVEEGYSTGSFALKTEDGYLGNGAKSTNQLKVYSNKNNKRYSWTISISSTGAADIVISDTEVTSNTIRFYSTSSYFSCYGTAQTAVAIYIKKSVNYTYSDMKLQFGGCMSKELYESLITEDSDASFGIELSKDGTEYTSYSCTPAYVTAMGDTEENEDGNYVQFFTVIPEDSEEYNTVIYAKCYVEINGTKYYMISASYSIKTLCSYYLTNASSLNLTDEQISAVKGLVS